MYEKLGIPSPDLVIYLSVDPQVSQQLMTRRYSGDESKKDIHERDRGYLSRSQAAARFCADHLGWKTVECCRDGAMRSIEDIHREIQGLLQEAILKNEEE